MSIPFHPRAGQVLVCNFDGFKEPEISPKLPYRSDLVAVVPVSLTEPKHGLPYCFRLSKNYHPGEADDLPCWAKADLVLNLGLYRMSGFKVGRRRWEYPQLTGADLSGVRHAVLCGLGLDGD
jgi:mRNA interferase MazF